MTILSDVLAELFGMFLADAHLSAAIIAVVALAAVLIDVAGVEPLIGGGLLLVGCPGVMIAAVLWTARRKKRESGS